MKILIKLLLEYFKKKILLKKVNLKLIKLMKMHQILHNIIQIEYRNGYKMQLLIHLYYMNLRDINRRRKRIERKK
jgi:hypothetical protein